MSRSTPIAQIPHTVDIADDDETVQEVLNQIAESTRQAEDKLIEAAATESILQQQQDGGSGSASSPHLHHNQQIIQLQQQQQMLQKQIQQQQHQHQPSPLLRQAPSSSPQQQYTSSSSHSEQKNYPGTNKYIFDLRNEDAQMLLLVMAVCIVIQVVPIERIVARYIPVVSNYVPYSDIIVKAAAGGMLFFAIRRYLQS